MLPDFTDKLILAHGARVLQGELAKPQEKTLADKRASFLTQNIGNGLTAEEVQTHDPGRDFILNELIEGCKGQNITYSVIDGFDIPLDKIKII